jgi:hypothetical protein
VIDETISIGFGPIPVVAESTSSLSESMDVAGHVKSTKLCHMTLGWSSRGFGRRQMVTV